jgi:hypothetical protein
LIPKTATLAKDEKTHYGKKCFGEIRKAVVNFVAGLLNAGDEDIENALIENEIFEKVMDLFFEFKTCNIVSSTIMQLIIIPVFEDGIDTIKDVLIDKYNLLDKIVENYHDPLDKNNSWSVILSNNGFLTQISSIFIKFGIGSDNSNWNNFTKSKVSHVVELQNKKEKLPERTVSKDKSGKFNMSQLAVDVDNISTIKIETN